MITKYAIEKAEDGGKPTGKFVFKMPEAKMAAYEILGTHMKLTGKDAEEYIAKNLESTFRHFDTADQGEIEAERMSGFFRFFTGNMRFSLD